MGDLVRYRWRYYCDIRKRFITTKHLLSEDLIKKEHPDAIPVEGSKNVMSLSDDPGANRFSSILSNAPLPWWKKD